MDIKAKLMPARAKLTPAKAGVFQRVDSIRCFCSYWRNIRAGFSLTGKQFDAVHLKRSLNREVRPWEHQR